MKRPAPSRPWLPVVLVAGVLLLLANLVVVTALLLRDPAPTRTPPPSTAAVTHSARPPARPSLRATPVRDRTPAPGPGRGAPREPRVEALAASPSWPVPRPEPGAPSPASTPAAQTCETDEQCQGSLRCVAQACVPPTPEPPKLNELACKLPADCPGGMRCDLGRGRCRHMGPGCETTDDCPPGWSCQLRDGHCVQVQASTCETDADCPNGAPCTAGACVSSMLMGAGVGRRLP